ncbi:MAG TPA: hypothetical protein DCZ93_01510 [Elusimicrobia bacterium]|nr:hypothetical protein [Elusimicrobiota bacterium]
MASREQRHGQQQEGAEVVRYQGEGDRGAQPMVVEGRRVHQQDVDRRQQRNRRGADAQQFLKVFGLLADEQQGEAREQRQQYRYQYDVH